MDVCSRVPGFWNKDRFGVEKPLVPVERSEA